MSGAFSPFQLTGPDTEPLAASEWNAGTVSTLGTGLSITSQTINAQWSGGAVTTLGTGLSITGTTLNATATNEWNAGTVNAIGVGLSLSGNTLSAGAALPFFNVSAGVPALSSFTQVGIAGTTSIAQSSQDQIISLKDTGGNATDLRGVTYPAPSTPYRVAMLVCLGSALNQLWGLNWGWSDGTKYATLYFFVNYSSDGFYTIDWSNSTTLASSNGVVSGYGFTPIWLGCRNDGTTLYFEFSGDGVNFETIYSVAIASAYCTPTNVFVGFSPQSSSRPSSMSIQCFDLNGLTRSFP